jgi:hypothetical protein
MSDDRVEAIIRRSVAYRCADALISGVEHAWTHSRARRIVTIGDGERMRFWASTTIVAAVTAMLLSPLGTTPRPLAWLLPAIAFAVGLLVVLLAARR